MLLMNKMEKFNELFVVDNQTIKVNENKLNKFKEIVPKGLIKLWKEKGVTLFNDGLFWLIDPDAYAFILEDWNHLLDDGAIPIAKTAFGNFYLWEPHPEYPGFRYLDMVNETSRVEIDDVDVLFNVFLTDTNYQQKYLNLDLFTKALEKCGKLTEDECYGFEPIPALGGKKSIQHVVKLVTKEYSSICVLASIF